MSFSFGDRYLLFDGAMGTMLMNSGMKAGAAPELLCISQPDLITDIHRRYVEAGADVITTNTFGANRFKLPAGTDVTSVVSASVACAKASGAKYIALDVGPTGAMLPPLGDTSPDLMYDAFAEQIKAGEKAGADLVIIETMSDMLEAKTALLAARENSSLPVFLTMSFNEEGRTFTGTSAAAAAITFSGLADAFGANCSAGPDQLENTIAQIARFSSLPVIAQPNAGMPQMKDGESIYTMTPDEFCTHMCKLINAGASIIGGCCGTDPRFISALRALTAGKTPPVRTPCRVTACSGSIDPCIFGGRFVTVGERINPTGKKKVREAFRNKDLSFIVSEAVSQQNDGADILELNSGVPGEDESKIMKDAVMAVNAACTLPLQLDTSDPAAMETGLRYCRSKPVLNSINGKQESIDAFVPLAKKYGCLVIGLTLDSTGIPETAAGRLEIAGRIKDACISAGIPQEDIIIDCLVMTASANQEAAQVTLDTIKLVHEKLGLRTIAGISNISFGLPSRAVLNSVYLAQAIGAGLDSAITDIGNDRIKDVVFSSQVINGSDASCTGYIGRFSDRNDGTAASVSQNGDIYSLIIKGNVSDMTGAASKALESTAPKDLIDSQIIPALNAVGKDFERGTLFLPQLMSSASAAKAAFSVIETKYPSQNTGRGTIVLATVKDDIHDIGKNIVAMFLRNYGYNVIDLGRNVPPEKIVQTVVENDIKLVGLSALMTTTAENIKVTVEMLKNSGCTCKVMAGGAVLSEQYTKECGADYYVKDAAASSKVADEVFSKEQG